MARIQKVICASCTGTIRVGASYCDHCGQPTTWASYEERIDWEVRQWRNARSRSGTSEVIQPRLPSPYRSNVAVAELERESVAMEYAAPVAPRARESFVVRLHRFLTRLGALFAARTEASAAESEKSVPTAAEKPILRAVPAPVEPEVDEAPPVVVEPEPHVAEELEPEVVTAPQPEVVGEPAAEPEGVANPPAVGERVPEGERLILRKVEHPMDAPSSKEPVSGAVEPRPAAAPEIAASAPIEVSAPAPVKRPATPRKRPQRPTNKDLLKRALETLERVEQRLHHLEEEVEGIDEAVRKTSPRAESPNDDDEAPPAGFVGYI